MVNLPGILALNNANAAETSLLAAGQLQRMTERAFCFAVIGEADAVLLAFDQDAEYDSPNFLWLRARHARFVYVDRIVVAHAARGRGLASRLYHDLFDQALAAGHDQVLCEVNLDPPNPGSDAFHARLGFTEIGRATLAGSPPKTVRYLRRRLDRPGPAVSADAP